MHDFLSSDFFQIHLFRNTIRVSNSLDPDQAQQNIGPDLRPICVQRLSAEDVVDSSQYASDNKFCRLWITFANSLDPHQGEKNV